MQDMAERLAKLRDDADDCLLISRLATDKPKRELFAKRADDLTAMALDVERAQNATSAADGKRPQPGKS
jgi:hypothetical protein